MDNYGIQSDPLNNFIQFIYNECPVNIVIPTFSFLPSPFSLKMFKQTSFLKMLMYLNHNSNE